MPNAASSAGIWSNTVSATTLVNKPSAPSVTGSLASTTVTGSINSAATCSVGTNIRYGFSSSYSTTNTDGSSSSWSVWAPDLSQIVTSTAAQGAKYKIKAQARCEGPNAQSPATDSSNVASVIIPIATPSPVTVNSAATGTNDSNTWSWASTCPADTTVTYISDWYRDDATGWRAWDLAANEFTVSSKTMTTNYQGYSYKVKVRTRCVTIFTSITAWSGDSNAGEYIRTITPPDNASNLGLTLTTTSGNPMAGYHGVRPLFSWTEPSCTIGTVPTYNWAAYLYVAYLYGAYGQVQTGVFANTVDPWTAWASASPESYPLDAPNSYVFTNYYTPYTTAPSSYSPPTVTNQPSNEIDVGNATPFTLTKARFYTRYRCENPTTGRVSLPSSGIFSNLATW